MRILSRFLERVEQKLVVVQETMDSTHYRMDRSRGLFKLRDPDLNQETHCATCGLPKDKHVPHDPPDVAKPGEDAEPKEWAPFYKAQDKLYREALQALNDGELTSMPLPISKRRLKVIVVEVKDRLEKAPPSRYARIASDDDDL